MQLYYNLCIKWKNEKKWKAITFELPDNQSISQTKNNKTS